MTPTIPRFLAPVGRPEREPLRWLAWVGLSMVFMVAGALLLGVLLAMTGGAEIVEAAGAEPLPEGPRRLVDEVRFIFVLALSLAMLAVALLAAARISFGRPAWTFVSPVRPFRLRLMVSGFVVFAVLVAGSLLVERLLVGEALDAPLFDGDYASDARLIYLGGGALFLLLAAASEEIVFRGLFLQITGALTRNATALVLVNGLLFSAIHLDPSPGAFTARAVAGAVWAWTVLRLGGIEFALGAHFANNLLLTMLAEPFSEGVQTGREIPWPYLLGDVVVTLGTAVGLHYALRSAGVRGLIGAPEPVSLPEASGGPDASPRNPLDRDAP